MFLNRMNGFLSLGGSKAGGPSLYLSFLLGETIDPRITFTRASSATRVNASGLIETVSTDVARIDYDPVSLACKGLLIEEARTNGVLYSNDYTNAAWQVYDCTKVGVNTNYAAPDGTTGVMEVSFGSIGGSIGSASALYTYAVAAGIRTAALGTWVRTKTGTTTVRLCALDAGAIYSGSADLAVTTTWTRLPLAVSMAADITQYSLRNNVAGNTGTILVWNSQIEPGAFPTSEVYTTSATVTRAADIPVITGANFSSWFNQAAGTFVFIGTSPGSGTRVIWQADDNTANNRYTLYTTGTSLKFDVVSGGVTQASLTLGTITANAQFKAAVAFAANDIAGVLNGGTVQTDASATLPTVDRFRLGVDTTGNYQCGYHSNDSYFSQRLSNAQLQALSA